MSKKRLQLSGTDLKAIEDTIAHSSDKDVVKRAMALRQLHNGEHPDEIAEMFVVTASTVYNWRKRWLEGGLEGLVNKPKSGRPGKASEHYCALLDEALACDPGSYGYDFTIWTLDRLRAHLEKQTGIALSRGRFRILLRQRGYVYRRPKRDLSQKQDPEAKAQARALIEELKRGPNRVISSYSLWTKPVSA
jgi:transposase